MCDSEKEVNSLHEIMNQNLPAMVEPFVQSGHLPHDETRHQKAWKDSHSNNLE
jgi:hypothetical protein